MTTDSDDEIRIRCSTPELLAMPFVRYLFSRKEKRSSSRGLGLVTKGIWAMFEPSQAKTILYYIGRMAGREISEATEKEYNTKKAKTWPELLGNIEIFCDLLAGSRATVTDVSSNRAIIKLYDSPSCYKVSGFPSPVATTWPVSLPLSRLMTSMACRPLAGNWNVEVLTRDCPIALLSCASLGQTANRHFDSVSPCLTGRFYVCRSNVSCLKTSR